MGIDAELLVRTRKQFTEHSVRAMAHSLAAAFGYKNFFIWRPVDGDGPRHCLELVEEFEQDGATLYPEEGETFIRVHLYTRYYGIGYERGDLPLIINVARWLETRIDDASIWYGGDSSGVCATPFDATARDELWRHFVQHGHGPYMSYLAKSEHNEHCSFCGDVPMYAMRWGGDGTGYVCHGCGLHRLVTQHAVAEAYGHYPDEGRRGS